MNESRQQNTKQARWNQYGRRQLRDIEDNPDKFINLPPPFSHSPAYDELMMLLRPLHDRKILELGCGCGQFSIFLSKIGAKVIGIDIGPDLIAASEALARVNQVSCIFCQGNITNLPFKSESYDIVLDLKFCMRSPKLIGC